MATIIYLTRPIQPKKEERVITFPLFKLVFDKIKKIKNDIYQRKIEFLHNQAYIEFYYQFAPRKSSGVDIPAFMYEEQRRKRAYDEATKALLQVIKDCRVNECYKARKEELRRRRGQ
jgi:hypothetical protein